MSTMYKAPYIYFYSETCFSLFLPMHMHLPRSSRPTNGCSSLCTSEFLIPKMHRERYEPHFFFSSHQFLCLSTNFSSPHRNKIPHSLIVDQMYSITYFLLIEIIIDLQNLIFEILLSEAKEEEEEEKVRESRWILSRVKRKEDSNGA